MRENNLDYKGILGNKIQRYAAFLSVMFDKSIKSRKLTVIRFLRSLRDSLF